MNKIINFIRYHNLVPIILGVVLLLTATAFASEGVRNAVIGEEIVTEQGIDNSQILAADLDNFDMALQILNVTEDAKKYYIDYTFRTIAIQDNGWQEVWREKRLAVSKKYLGDGDLALYVAEELGQVVDNELAYLKEVQEIEREKGLQKIVASIEYTGLLGLLSDLKERVEPICQPVDEVCDGIDNDCDGLVDEDLGQTTCGTGVCLVTVDKCFNGALVACVPGAPSNEICGDSIDNNCDGVIDNSEICQVQEEPICQPTMEVCDGLDNDCDGQVDEGLVQQCGVSDIGACQLGTQTCLAGIWGGCVGVVGPGTEICDSIDNNCNGEIDEGGICETAAPSTEEPPPEPDASGDGSGQAAEAPAEEQPIEEEPSVEEPAEEESVVEEEPVLEESPAEEPTVEEPVVEEPVLEEPVPEEEPVIEEEPVVDEPVEESVNEEPIEEEPITE